jgi:uncharacterized protein YjbI with pentapeptide repeats
MSTSSSSIIPDSGSVNCQCEWLIDYICGEGFYKEHDGRRYCVFHYPSKDKKEDFESALQTRLAGTGPDFLNFQGVWFPSHALFAEHVFTDAADFTSARFSEDAHFNGTQFKQVFFIGAEFNGTAFFENARFDGDAHFEQAHFKGHASFTVAQFYGDGLFAAAKFRQHASFPVTRFERASFVRAEFDKDVDFRGSEFKETALFGAAQFREHADFGPAHIVPDPQSAGAEPKWDQIEAKPTQIKSGDFRQARFKTANFREARFTELASFGGAEFTEDANFYTAEFRNLDFSMARLKRSDFGGASFCGATKFNTAEFSEPVDFSTALFEGVDFSDVTFDKHANFRFARFQLALPSHDGIETPAAGTNEAGLHDKSRLVKVSFDRATFRDGLTFQRSDFFPDRVLLTFDSAIFERPERVKFLSVSLPPYSFMNVDPRKFDFVDARWGFLNRRSAVSEAKRALSNHGVGYSDAMLELAFRQLAVNAEENNRYEEAADLRFLAMETKRLSHWRKIDWLRLSWWYWLLSGYGERVQKAFGVLMIIWALFAMAYWSGDSSWWKPQQTNSVVVESGESKSQLVRARPQTFAESLIYSGLVMALQKPEPIPANKRARLLVLLETVFGPVQAALLALAIRRKFIR